MVEQKKNTAEKKPETLKSKAVSQLLFGLSLIVLINIISNYLFFRIDLTNEKRFTLSPVSKNLAGKLDDVLYITVY